MRAAAREIIELQFKRTPQIYLTSKNLLFSEISNQVIYRDHLAHQDEVYNLSKKKKKKLAILLEKIKRRATICNVFGLLNNGKRVTYTTFNHSTFIDEYTFWFSSPCQETPFVQRYHDCLDATH